MSSSSSSSSTWPPRRPPCHHHRSVTPTNYTAAHPECGKQCGNCTVGRGGVGWRTRRWGTVASWQNGSTWHKEYLVCCACWYDASSSRSVRQRRASLIGARARLGPRPTAHRRAGTIRWHRGLHTDSDGRTDGPTVFQWSTTWQSSFNDSPVMRRTCHLSVQRLATITSLNWHSAAIYNVLRPDSNYKYV